VRNVTSATLRLWVAALAGLAAFLVAVPTAAHASSCGGVAVVVHDIASGPASMAAVGDVARSAGWCVVTPSYGRNASPFGFLPGGMGGIDASADQLAAVIKEQRRLHPGRPLHVVAHGVGSLAAMRAAQRFPTAVPDSLIAIGPLWDGTNIALIGTLEQLSRDAGTYRLVLAIEAPLEDPVCRACREIIHGSDFLREFRAAGLAPRGLVVTNIVSRLDLLVQPVTSGVIEGANNFIVQDQNPLSLANHWTLPTDRVVLRHISRLLE